MKKLLSVSLILLLLLTACTPKDETAGSTATDSDLVINTDSDLTVMGEAEIGQAEGGSSNVKLPDAIEEAPPEFYEDTKNDQPTDPDTSVSSEAETPAPDSNSSSAGATAPGYEGDSTAPYDPNAPEMEIIESNSDLKTF